jgi:hypothetical protein
MNIDCSDFAYPLLALLALTGVRSLLTARIDMAPISRLGAVSGTRGGHSVGPRFLAPSDCIARRDVLVGIQIAARYILAEPAVVLQSAPSAPPDDATQLTHP